MFPLRCSAPSITPQPGQTGHSGGGDAPSVHFNPTSSLSGRKALQGQWASSSIQKKVNGLLCSKLALLLGLATPGLKWMGSPTINDDINDAKSSNITSSPSNKNTNQNNATTTITNTTTTTQILLQVSADGGVKNIGHAPSKSNHDSKTKVMEYLEVYDYIGGASFRGLIAEKETSTGSEKSLFLFFEEGVQATELKQGLVALIDLATECFNCQNLVVCLDRELDGLNSLIHDLGWVGLELVTLKHWSTEEDHKAVSGSEQEYTSEKWLFLGMEL